MDKNVNTIKVVTLNVNGIQNKIKRHKILTYLRSLNCDIAKLQETHLNAEQSKNLKQQWVGQFFSSSGSQASQGVSILISKNIAFKLSKSHTDLEGRYIIVTGLLQNQKLTLVNIYAPNISQPFFLSALYPVISCHMEGPLVIAGDFNCVLNALLDRSNGPLPSDR